MRNGTRATVIGVDTTEMSLRIRTDDGRIIRLPESYLEHVQHGYAQTGHASQGATVDQTYLLASPARGGREWGYTAGSRHRIDLHAYTVHHDRDEAREQLERTWLRSQAKTLAIDRLSDSSQKAFERMRAAALEAQEARAAAQRARDDERRARSELEAQRGQQNREDEHAREQRDDDLTSEPDTADDIAAWIERERAAIDADLWRTQDERDRDDLDELDLEPDDERERSIEDDDDDDLSL